MTVTETGGNGDAEVKRVSPVTVSYDLNRWEWGPWHSIGREASLRSVRA